MSCTDRARSRFTDSSQHCGTAPETGYHGIAAAGTQPGRYSSRASSLLPVNGTVGALRS